MGILSDISTASGEQSGKNYRANEKKGLESVAADWNRDYKGIGVIYEGRIVRILNDAALKTELESSSRSAKSRRRNYKQGCLEIAEHIRSDYEQSFGTGFPFSVKSLACEIYWHYIIKEKAEAAERRFGKKKLTSWLLMHMEVVDCGDGKADNNRFLWDLLSLFF